MIKRNKHKLLSRIFSVITVIVLLFSLTLNIFAESSSLYSSGASSDSYYTLNGHPFVVNFHLVTGSYFSSSVSPCLYLDNLDPAVYSFDNVSYDSGYLTFDYSFFNFEYSENLFISSFPSGYFACNMSLQFSASLSDPSIASYYTIEARDFYYYISSDYLSFDNTDDDSHIQFALNLGDPFFTLDSDPTFEMYYTFGGNLDIADNRNYYSGDAKDNDGNVLFYPGDDFILSNLDEYPDGYLIYVEYACLSLPVSTESINIVGTYYTDIYNYRDIDLESYEDPISPINPGVFRDYTSWIGTAVGGFLDLELVDGFTLGGILMVLIAFMITMWFLKVFAGG